MLDMYASTPPKFLYGVDVLVAGSHSRVVNSEACRIITLKVPFFNSKFFFLAKYFYARKVKKFLKIRKGEYDVFHFHGDNGYIGEDFAAKSVLTLHGIALSKNSIFNRLTSFLPSQIERKNVMNAQIVFSISKEAADFFSRFSKKPIQIIKQSVDTDFYRPLPVDAKMSLRKELGFSAEAIIGVIVGTDPVRKGLYTAIKAVEMTGDPRVVLVGIGFPALTFKASRYNHMGKVDANTKLRYLQIADFFIFPSIKEGFPISILEAASVCLPLIVSKNSGVSELEALVPYYYEVDVSQPSEYKSAIEIFIEWFKNNKHTGMIQEQKFLNEYSILSMAQIYSRTYKSLKLDFTSQMINEWPDR